MLPEELVVALRDHYALAGLVITEPATREPESAEYGACRLGIDGKQIAFRVAKTTPTKIGQFVTIWKRPSVDADIAPLDTGDGVDFVVISVADPFQHGQFIFSQQTLARQGVFSVGGRGGKRAIRVYPPWSHPTAKDAVRTQQWQLRHFVRFGEGDAGPELHRLFALWQAR